MTFIASCLGSNERQLAKYSYSALAAAFVGAQRKTCQHQLGGSSAAGHPDALPSSAGFSGGASGATRCAFVTTVSFRTLMCLPKLTNRR
jgi:hypothetical protein